MKKWELSQSTLCQMLHYDPKTGHFAWLPRPLEFITETKATPKWVTKARMDARFAGKRVGTVDKKGYLRIFLFGNSYPAHVLAWLYMTGEWPTEEVDHRNLQKMDNRWDNLRPATSQQNARNRRVRSDSSTGLKGVKPHEGRFHARIQTSNKRISLGLYDCPVAAHFAYVVAADKFHGEFARTA